MADVASIQKEMFELIQARDFVRLREFFHPDFEYTSPTGEVGGVDESVGLAEVFTTAFPDLSFEARTQFGAGDLSCLELVARGTHEAEFEGIAPTGRTITVTGCNVIELKDGLVYRERDYFDSMVVMQQLGVAP